MATQNDKSMLLALPLELLEKIVQGTGYRSLFSLRLTCKTLEAAARERFGRQQFCARKFCVYDEARLTLLKKILSSQLASSLSTVTLTTDALEEKFFRHIQLAQPKDSTSMGAAQRAARDALQNTAHGTAESNTWPSTALIFRVLGDLKEFAPNARVNIMFHKPNPCDTDDSDHDHDYDSDDDDNHHNVSERGTSFSVREKVLFAAIMARVNLRRLDLTTPFTKVFSRLHENFGSDLLACMSLIRNFGYHSPVIDVWDWISTDDGVNAIGQVMKMLDGKSLRTLRIHDVRPLGKVGTMDVEPSTFLKASNFTYLATLQFARIFCKEEDLVAVLSRCSSTLMNLSLEKIHVCAPRDHWLEVFRTLVEMPKLLGLRIAFLRKGATSTAWNVSLIGIQDPTSSGGKFSRSLEAEEIKPALQILTSLPLTYGI